MPWVAVHEWMSSRCWSDTTIAGQRTRVPQQTKKLIRRTCHPDNEEVGWEVDPNDEIPELVDLELIDEDEDAIVDNAVPLHGVQVVREKYVDVQRNAARVKGTDDRLLPKPVVIQMKINDSPVRALIDSGSLGDFISSTVVDQLKLK